MWTSFSTGNPLVLVSLFKSFIHGLHKLHILKCTWKGSLLFFLQRYCFPESTRKTARQSRTWSTLDLVSLVCWMISTARLMKSSFHCNAMQQSQCNFWYGGWCQWQVMHIKLYVMASPWSGALLARQQGPKASDAANKFVWKMQFYAYFLCNFISFLQLYRKICKFNAKFVQKLYKSMLVQQTLLYF